MSEKVILHQPCQEPLSEDEKKLVIDEYLREMRSKGGRQRWAAPKAHSPEAKEKFSEALSNGWKKRRKAAKKKKA